MSPLDFVNHLLNFALPAVAMGVMMPLLSRLLWRKTAVKRSLLSQMIISSLACVVVLLAGLVIFSTDGKMMTYIGVILAAAGCQWWFQGGLKIK